MYVYDLMSVCNRAMDPNGLNGESVSKNYAIKGRGCAVETGDIIRSNENGKYSGKR